MTEMLPVTKLSACGRLISVAYENGTPTPVPIEFDPLPSRVKVTPFTPLLV